VRSGFRVLGCAPPPADEAASLIEKETLKKRNRSQVQGSTFRVKDKEGIKDPKSLLKMLISSNNCQFVSKF
jgi:hypothetical protein